MYALRFKILGNQRLTLSGTLVESDVQLLYSLVVFVVEVDHGYDKLELNDDKSPNKAKQAREPFSQTLCPFLFVLAMLTCARNFRCRVTTVL